MQLSKYFTLEEMVASQTAARKGIANIPTTEHFENLRHTCQMADAVREFLGHPMRVSSGYRSLKLNTAVGGSKTSAHSRGEAMDFTCHGFGTTEDVFEALRDSGIRFDQIILEYPSNPSGSWVHIGFSPEMRQQALVFDGKQYAVA